MKCFVLAGGTGDRLWPISRKNYPKQFTEMHEGRSLFQETIVRNMPLCDEFYIFINERYLNIVKGQLQYFQNLRYKLFVETGQLKTALPILIAALSCKKDELILIVSADAIVGEGNYKESVTKAKNLAAEGYLTLITVPADKAQREYKYLECDGNKIIKFIDRAEDIGDIGERDYRYDVGVSVNRSDVLLKQFERRSPEMYYKTEEIIKRLNFYPDEILLDYRDFDDVPKLSLGKALQLSADIARAVPAEFEWECCFNLETLKISGCDSNAIVNESKNVTVINSVKDRLVVVNRIDDAVVVNTRNAVYISSKQHSTEIKDIIKKNAEKYKYYFEESEVYYQTWGIKEYISKGKGYRITKMTIFPGKFLREHSHETRSEHWSVVSGSANITINGVTKNYSVGESAVAKPNDIHRLGNVTDKSAIIIETALDPQFEGLHEEYIITSEDPFYRLLPAFKDYLWGGTRIKDILGKKTTLSTVAESWEISAHPVGQSRVSGGKYGGVSLGVLLSRLGKNSLGWKSQAFDRFPLLVKFIDAHLNLSIQVHPGDDYALMVENEYGKNEMWYVMDCAENSYIYLGFNRNVSADEVRARIEDDTLPEVLNKIHVKKGDTFYIPAGTVHAIGEGILICEVQQNSNATYRLYDYGRKDRDGKTRALHIDKALDVLNMNKILSFDYAPDKEECFATYTRQLLCECKYFSVEKYSAHGECVIYLDTSSFAGVVIISGSGTISILEKSERFNIGDTFFIPAQAVTVRVSGECEFLKIGL